MDQILTAKDVAIMIGLSANTVRAMARIGKLPCFYPTGAPTKIGESKRVKFLKSAIEQYIKENRNAYSNQSVSSR